jgi:hypothetical protein
VSARSERKAQEMTGERRALRWLPTPDDRSSLPDLLISAVAQRSDGTVLHYDHDYDAIAKVTNQPTRWLVAPGSLEEPTRQARLERRGYATVGSVSTLTTAGRPLAKARSSAGRSSTGADTSSPWPPNARTISS